MSDSAKVIFNASCGDIEYGIITSKNAYIYWAMRENKIYTVRDNSLQPLPFHTAFNFRYHAVNYIKCHMLMHNDSNPFYLGRQVATGKMIKKIISERPK